MAARTKGPGNTGEKTDAVAFSFGNATTIVESSPPVRHRTADATTVMPPVTEATLATMRPEGLDEALLRDDDSDVPVPARREPTVRVQLFTSLRVAVLDEQDGEKGPIVTALRTLNAPTTVVRSAADLKAVVTREAFHTVFVMIPGDVEWAVELLEWGAREVRNLHWVPVLLDPRPARLKALWLAGAVEILEPPLPSAIGLLLRAAASAPMDLPTYITGSPQFLAELGLYWRAHEDAVAAYRNMLRDRLVRIEESRERMRRGVEKAVQKQREAMAAHQQATVAQAQAEGAERTARELLTQLASMQQRLFSAEEELAASERKLAELTSTLEAADSQREKLVVALRHAQDEATARQQAIDGLTRSLQQATANASGAISDETRQYTLHVQRTTDAVLLTLMALPRTPEVQRCIDLLHQMQAAPVAAPPMVVGRLT